MVYFAIYSFGLISGNIFILFVLSLLPVLLLLPKLAAQNAGFTQYIVSYFIVLSIPVSGLLTSYLIEKNISSLKNKQFISRTAFIITVALCLQSIRFVDFLTGTVTLQHTGTHAETLAIVVNVCNACLKSAAISAFGILFLVNIVELPFIWFCQAFGLTNKARIPYSGIRPAISFLVFIYSFDFIVDLLSSKMWPDIFLK